MEPEFNLLIKYLTGHISDDELNALDTWRKESVENEQLFSEAARLRISKEFENQDNSFKTLSALRRFQSATKKKKNRRFFYRVLKYAAIFILLVTISVVARSYFAAQQDTVVAVEGSVVKRVHLADGTNVWLSGGSELRIPKTFGANKRNVSFTGKAFFDVQKNPASPFTVTGRYVDVKVTGTSFDLTTDAQGKSLEAILATGKITLQDKRKQDVYTMLPGEKVTYHAEGNRYTVKNVDVNTLTAWRLDQITFENATLREIVNRLSVIYNVNINLQSKKMAERRYRYVINKEETLEEVLKILTYLTPLKYKIEGNEVFITE